MTIETGRVAGKGATPPPEVARKKKPEVARKKKQGGPNTGTASAGEVTRMVPSESEDEDGESQQPPSVGGEVRSRSASPVEPTVTDASRGSPFPDSASDGDGDSGGDGDGGGGIDSDRAAKAQAGVSKVPCLSTKTPTLPDTSPREHAPRLQLRCNPEIQDTRTLAESVLPSSRPGKSIWICLCAC